MPLPLTRRRNAAFESDLAGFMAEQKARRAEREQRLHALLANKAECHRLSDLLLLENRVRRTRLNESLSEGTHVLVFDA